MGLQSAKAGLGITVSRRIGAENVVIDGGIVVIAFDVTDIFIGVTGSCHASRLIVSAIDAIVNQQGILLQGLSAIGDELGGDGDGIQLGLFAEDHVAMIHKKHVEVHHATGAAVQGVGVLPGSGTAVACDTNDLITRHRLLIYIQCVLVVCAVAAHRDEHGVVQDEAVGIGSQGVPSGFIDAIHGVGVAPAAVGVGKIFGHLFVVLIPAV